MKGHTSIDAQEHPIEAVTLYSKRAEVRRVITLELKAGRNDFAITNLPSSIVPDTFHISGLSAGQASVVDTTCVVPPSKPALFGAKSAKQQRDVSDKKDQTRVELEMKKNQLLREQSLIHAKNDVLLSYAKTLTGENTQREDFIEFLAQFNEAGQQSLIATTQIEAAIEDIELRIKKMNLVEKDDESSDEEIDLSPKQKTKAGVVISAKEVCSVKLILTYVVSGASWTPAYELHATTDSTTKTVANSVTLHYRASVIQKTGEDWDDVNLTLSTAELSTNMAVPTLTRCFIRDASYRPAMKGGLFGAAPNNINVSGGFRLGAVPTDPPNQQQAQQQQQQAPQILMQQQAAPFSFGTAPSSTTGGLFGSSSSANTAAFGSTGFGSTAPTAALTSESTPQSPVLVEATPEYQPLDHAGAEAKDQILATTYRVDTPVRVQSDDTPHRVTIMTVQLAAKTEYCKVKNTSSHQFPPGPIVTYLDGSYIESSRIWLILPKGEITRSLGTDPGIRVSFKRATEIKKAPPANTFARQTTTIVTDTLTIKNTRSSVIPRVLVRHAIPTPGNDERFRVTLKEPDGLAQLETGSSFKLRERVNAKWIDDASSGTESSGLLEWSIDQLAAEGNEEIKMIYEVAAPEGVKWNQA
ncbi:mucoidy inhibitor A [Ceratobasidium sp. AG-Ba]|nr:mucoidy inhibitor A [Ceratobasidium sp. AG-Ba]